jgi:hypothetical protein
MLILTPAYQSELSGEEIQRLKISLKNNGEFQHAFLCPENMNTSKYTSLFWNSAIYRVADSHFNSTETYNRLMKSTELYKLFPDYTHILILQMDAVLIETVPFVKIAEYDYIGAIWPQGYQGVVLGKSIFLHSGRCFRRLTRSIYVGNGGLSLRKVASHIELLKKIESKKRYFPQSNLNEDVFFSFLFDKYGYNVPTKELADSIFQELSAVSQTQIPNVVGFHGLDRLNPELEKKIFLLHGVE